MMADLLDYFMDILPSDSKGQLKAAFTRLVLQTNRLTIAQQNDMLSRLVLLDEQFERIYKHVDDTQGAFEIKWMVVNDMQSAVDYASRVNDPELF